MRRALGVVSSLVAVVVLASILAQGQVRTLIGHTDAVLSVAFSPDGKILASASQDRTIKLWDATAGTLLTTLSGHTSFISSIAFSPDGKTLASGSNDHTVKLWDATARSCLRTLVGHTDTVWSVAFSPDGNTLASASSDGTIDLWDTTTGRLLRTLRSQTRPMSFAVRSCAFSPDGNTLASGSVEGRIELWEPATGTLLSSLCEHVWDQGANTVAFSSDGKTLAAGMDNPHAIKLWDVATGAPRATLDGHTWFVKSVAFSPDGRALASASYDQTIKLWDVATGTLVRTLTGHTGYVWSVAFSPDGKTLASASQDKTIKLWDVVLGSAPITPTSTPAVPGDVVHFGTYDLRKVSLLRCASARGRPYTSILLSRDGESWMMLPDVLLDSGADTSLFPAGVADALGIDLTQCPQGTSSGVGGTTTTYYAEVYVAIVHFGGIEADIDGYILASGKEPLLIKALVAFSKDDANADTYLLGRRDVFDSLTLTFQGDTATLTPAAP